MQRMVDTPAGHKEAEPTGRRRNERRTTYGAVRLVLVLAAAVVSLVALSACGSASSGGGKTTAGSNAASGQASDPVVAAAKSFVAKATANQTAWKGPTTGPKLVKGKTIAFVTCGSFAAVCVNEGKLVTKVAEAAGWKVTTLDGQGTVAGALAAFNQAISLNVSGIVSYGVSPTSIPSALQSAKAHHIPIIIMSAEKSDGASPSPGVFYDPTPSPCASGNAYAQYAIAASNGTARVVWETDSTYPSATVKTNCFKAAFAKCATCKLLKVVNRPQATFAQYGPAMVTGWYHQYGPKPFYYGSSTDFVFPIVIPALRAAGVTSAQMPMFGSDGSATSYNAIRQGNDFIVATFPLPLEEMAYLSIDAVNRALTNTPASTYTPPPYIVDSSNVDAQGGKDDLYKPDDGYARHFQSIWGTK